MSDLYEVLRRRVDVVAEWADLGAARMSEAQKALGLSDERAARQVPVSTRTWIRWRQRGQVPVHLIDRVGEVLQLEIERPTFDRVVHFTPSAATLEGRLARIEDLLEGLSAQVDDGQQATAESLAGLAAAIDGLSERPPAAKQRVRRHAAG